MCNIDFKLRNLKHLQMCDIEHLEFSIKNNFNSKMKTIGILRTAFSIFILFDVIHTICSFYWYWTQGVTYLFYLYLPFWFQSTFLIYLSYVGYNLSQGIREIKNSEKSWNKSYYRYYAMFLALIFIIMALIVVVFEIGSTIFQIGVINNSLLIIAKFLALLLIVALLFFQDLKYVRNAN